MKFYFCSKSSIQFIDLHPIKDIIKRAELRLKDMLNAEFARIIIYDQKQHIYNYNDNGQKNIVPMDQGIAGKSIRNLE